MNVLVVIPARGGSKGIPRKNLRKLNGKPLIYYSIKTALSLECKPDVYVSSDDDEIIYTANLLGAKTHKRDPNISNDIATLDPVVYACYQYAKTMEGKDYELVVTAQPTSPLLKTKTLDRAICQLADNPSVDTLIAAKDNTHLSWKKVGNTFKPNYTKRVNRQHLEQVFTETGAFVISRSLCVTKTSRIGRNVDLFILSHGEDIDIDTYEDWNLCEYYLKKKRILFVVTGNHKVGLGHVYNALILASDILNHSIEFLVDKDSQLAFEKISTMNYPVFIQEHSSIIKDISLRSPDVVINDILDTSVEYTQKLKDICSKVINFEDLGPGAKYADMVINAIYPEKEVVANHYYGHKYYILRDEFLYLKDATPASPVNNVLLTFGGVDPNNFTKQVLGAIYEYCHANRIAIKIIAGFGYKKHHTLKPRAGVTIESHVPNISEHMNTADIIFTSAGRTLYEVASVSTPSIVLAQNERELTHFFASPVHGFINLGLGANVCDGEILSSFVTLVESEKMRKEMSRRMKEIDLKSGRKRVISLIQKVLEEV